LSGGVGVLGGLRSSAEVEVDADVGSLNSARECHLDVVGGQVVNGRSITAGYVQQMAPIYPQGDVNTRRNLDLALIERIGPGMPGLGQFDHGVGELNVNLVQRSSFPAPARLNERLGSGKPPGPVAGGPERS